MRLMDSKDRRQGRTSRRTTTRSDNGAPLIPERHIVTPPDDGDKPTHPHVQATLLMVGIVLFLVLVAALQVR